MLGIDQRQVATGRATIVPGVAHVASIRLWPPGHSQTAPRVEVTQAAELADACHGPAERDIGRVGGVAPLPPMLGDETTGVPPAPTDQSGHR